MNISQMMKNIIGEPKVSDTKTLDLKVGEIVRGTVIKLLSHQEALVNINGVTTSAKLETPLQQG